MQLELKVAQVGSAYCWLAGGLYAVLTSLPSRESRDGDAASDDGTGDCETVDGDGDGDGGAELSSRCREGSSAPWLWLGLGLGFGALSVLATSRDQAFMSH